MPPSTASPGPSSMSRPHQSSLPPAFPSGYRYASPHPAQLTPSPRLTPSKPPHHLSLGHRTPKGKETLHWAVRSVPPSALRWGTQKTKGKTRHLPAVTAKAVLLHEEAGSRALTAARPQQAGFVLPFGLKSNPTRTR